MIFAKLLLSPLPHARVTRLDTSAALAMPGVKAILTFDDLPKPADSINDNGQVIFANLDGEVPLTNEPVYQGQPILAVAAVDEVTAADAIEKIQIDFEPLPFVVDPIQTLRPGSPNARLEGNAYVGPQVKTVKWTEADWREVEAGRLPLRDAPDTWQVGDVETTARRVLLVPTIELGKLVAVSLVAADATLVSAGLSTTFCQGLPDAASRINKPNETQSKATRHFIDAHIPGRRHDCALPLPDRLPTSAAR
jgi:hypothetical protein